MEGKAWFGSRHITSNATLVWVAFFIAFHINWCLYVWWSRSIQLIWNAMKNVGCYVTIAWTHVYHLMANTLPYSAISRILLKTWLSKVGPSDDTRVTPHIRGVLFKRLSQPFHLCDSNLYSSLQAPPFGFLYQSKTSPRMFRDYCHKDGNTNPGRIGIRYGWESQCKLLVSRHSMPTHSLGLRFSFHSYDTHSLVSGHRVAVCIGLQRSCNNFISFQCP